VSAEPSWRCGWVEADGRRGTEEILRAAEAALRESKGEGAEEQAA